MIFSVLLLGKTIFQVNGTGFLQAECPYFHPADKYWSTEMNLA